MCNFAAVVKRVVPFVIAVVAGIIGFSLVAQTALEPESASTQVPVSPGTGISGGDHGSGGIGSGRDKEARPTAPTDTTLTENFRIISKPQARYTDEARTNDVEGTVRLKVTLLASGNIGAITPISELPDGLTERAVEAARHIKFQPKRVNGVPQSVIVTIEYNFNLY